MCVWVCIGYVCVCVNEKNDMRKCIREDVSERMCRRLPSPKGNTHTPRSSNLLATHCEGVWAVCGVMMMMLMLM